MAKTKISEFSATPANNTDIDSINIAEGCAPSGINDAIRELMSQLKDFQTGAVGDSFNGPVNGTLGATTPATASVTTLAASGAVTLSGGTANGVTYLNGSKVLTSGSALTFDGTNLNTTGNFQIGGTKMLSKITGDSYIWNNTSALNFVSSDGNTVQLKLDSSGNLGLGVTPSAWTDYKVLQLSGNSAVYALGSNEIGTVQNAYYNSGWKYGVSSVAASWNYVYQGATYWKQAPPGTAGNPITFTQAMTLDASGNLGIGTTSPTNLLHLAGSSATPSLRLASTSAGYYWDIGRENASTGDFVFNSASGGSSTEKARITTSGNLLIGRTSASVVVPRVDIQAANFGLAINTSNGGSNEAVRFYNASTAVGTITTTGSTTAYNTSSDYRLKNITGNLTGYKERVMSLQPKQGTWIVDGSEFRGFLAHDFANPYRASVVGEKDAVDENGNPMMQSMQASSSEVIADLVALVQEQQAIIDSLKARLDAANL